MRISPHTYASEGMLWSVFDGLEYNDFDACVARSNTTAAGTCYGRTGTEVLNALGDWGNVVPAYRALVLVAMAVFLRFLLWLVISRRRS